MKYVRGSEVSSFLRCRKQWKYSWIDQIEPRRPDGKLFFGNLAHKFMESYYRYDMNAHLALHHMRKYFDKTDTSHMAQTELDELWKLASGVMENYVAQWHHIDSKWTILATELRFAIPLDADTMYEGTIDLLYLDEYGDLRFMDHKNVASIERYVGMAEMDRQISRYYWALQQLARGNGYILENGYDPDGDWVDIKQHPFGTQIKGKEPKGFTYNLILKDVPNVPELLKSGKGLSKAKAQKTTYLTYLQALQDNGLMLKAEDGGLSIPEDYLDILDHLSAQETEFGNRFFRRVPVTRNEAEVQAAMHEFLAVNEDREAVIETMLIRNKALAEWGETNLSDPTYRNINADCSWCNYKALCCAEMSGDNAEFIRNTLYRAKETLTEQGDEAE